MEMVNVFKKKGLENLKYKLLKYMSLGEVNGLLDTEVKVLLGLLFDGKEE